MKVIMDSDCLIKLTRAKAKEVVLRNVEAYIPPKVFEETVTIPKEEGYPDAFIIEDNQKNGRFSPIMQTSQSVFLLSTTRAA